MFENHKIAFIGPGAMAEAMIAGLIRQKVAAPEALIAAGPRKIRLEQLADQYGVGFTLENAEAARAADVIVLSIKPQKLTTVLRGLGGSLAPESLVLSIVAGVPIEKIAGALNHSSIVRAMPNTPAQIGEGITVWTDSSSVTDAQKEMARRILAALGEEIYMDEEIYLDMATALSGTGPAYVFLFMEAMVDAGVHLGFPRRIAELLVSHTMRGSVDFYLKHLNELGSDVHLARLRNLVTSPGGTTASALYYLEKAGFRTAISRAIWAAYERSQELGEDHKAHSPDNNHKHE